MELSVVIPLHNEAMNVVRLYGELNEVLKLSFRDYEIIYIDDGSKDSTAEEIIRLIRQDKGVRMVSLTGNFGLSASLALGFKIARGRIILTMDGDMEHNPGDIPYLIKEIEKGYDLVCGYRKVRYRDMTGRYILSILGNKIARMVFKMDIHDFSTTFKAYRSHVARNMPMFNGAHRFVPVLARRMGFNVGETIISHRRRIYGVSNYNFTRLFKIIKDAAMIKINEILLRFGMSFPLKEAGFGIKYII
ncbi:MAG: glycosyltransferase family 2 protein [Candidatus Omnitrophota bacterium]